jgi:molybdopterin-guanine dinucleotide biosynthesis protein A
MGRDKATIVVGGVTLAARTARLLSAVASPCVEVGPGRSGLQAVEEKPRGGGPLVAVAAGVVALPRNASALVVACDLPRLTEPILQWLADHPAPGSVVPVWEGRPQPLCARWSGPALAHAVELAGTGARSMNALLGGSDALVVTPPPGLAAALMDVDTPDQLDEVGGVDST